MQYDALLAALVVFCVTLALFLFFPWMIADLPDAVRTAAVYLIVALVVAGFSLFIRRKLRK
jgi:hypothetical protein